MRYARNPFFRRPQKGYRKIFFSNWRGQTRIHKRKERKKPEILKLWYPFTCQEGTKIITSLKEELAFLDGLNRTSKNESEMICSMK